MPSNVLNSLLPCLRKEGEDADRSFLDNGSQLLEDLIASCDGKSNTIRHYSAQELIRATNNFDPSGIIPECSFYYKGFLDNRLIIIKKRGGRDGPYRNFKRVREEAIRDIIISMQMSTHKNVLKLLGCCLEFPIPALVHEYATQGCVLNEKGGFRSNESLPWKTRLRIAKQLASAITYLHTAFPRPIIHRHLRPHCIFLDDDFVPKLCDFSYSITIPPEKSHVQEVVIKGTMWYLSPEFLVSGYISEKFDVYSFGVILLGFLVGRKLLAGHDDLIKSVKLHACDGQIQTIVDPKILEELGGGNEPTQLQLHDFLALAWLCTRDERELRPDMIDVAKELMRIEKFIWPPC
ncbi:non-functional pseudokinase ZED1-like [Rosa sericea]